MIIDTIFRRGEALKMYNRQENQEIRFQYESHRFSLYPTFNSRFAKAVGSSLS